MSTGKSLTFFGELSPPDYRTVYSSQPSLRDGASRSTSGRSGTKSSAASYRRPRRMSRPKKVKLGRDMWTIRETAKMDKEPNGERLMGLCILKDKTILCQRGLPLREWMEILLHEARHAHGFDQFDEDWVAESSAQDIDMLIRCTPELKQIIDEDDRGNK